MSQRLQQPAGIRCKSTILRETYLRQHRELINLRRYICSLVPFATIHRIVEPGCGTGLLAMELLQLTEAYYTGIDMDKAMLETARKNLLENPKVQLLNGDAMGLTLSSDAYVSSFFLAGLRNPHEYLRRIRSVLAPDGLYIVFGEYDYQSIEEEPEMGLACRIRKSLRNDGYALDFGSRMNEVFESVDFRTLRSGTVQGEIQKPDMDFLRMQLDLGNEWETEAGMSWSIVWGIYCR